MDIWSSEFREKYAHLLRKEADTIPDKKKFIEKIKKAFHFRANIRAKEEKFIDSIIGRVFAADSIYKSIPDFKKKSAESFKAQKGSIDTLHRINSQLARKADRIQAKLDSLFESFKSTSSSAGKKKMTDQEMDQLATKMLPIVKEKVELEEADEESRKKIGLICQLMQRPDGIADTVQLNDTVRKRYTLKLGKHGEVYGYHPYWMKDAYLNYNFSVLNTLAFYGYELNEKTGGYKTLNGWDTVAVVAAAKRAGCKVELCVFSKSKENLSMFLKNEGAQDKLLSEVCVLLKKRKANGVNILFEGMEKNSRQRFTKFIRSFSQGLKQADSAYKLTLTIPVLDENQNYDVKQLDPSVDRFVIDFTKKQKYGPIAPLKGDPYSLGSGISRCLNTGVASSKFVAAMPYYGALWDFKTKTFEDYLQYNKITENYLRDYSKIYENGTARTDVIVDDQDTLEQLYYDDARTLSEKYDLVLKSKLGGVGIWALGYDNNQPELWDVLMDKMIYFDTTNIVQITRARPVPVTNPTLWAKIKRELVLYKLLFQHPCAFQGQLRSVHYVGYVTVIVLILLLLCTGFYIVRSRALGDEWKWRKLVLKTLITLVIFFMILLLLYCFLNPDFAHFGYAPVANTAVGDGSGGCDTTFGTILTVLGIGFLIGLVAMKFLVLPLTKRKEIP